MSLCIVWNSDVRFRSKSHHGVHCTERR